MKIIRSLAVASILLSFGASAQQKTMKHTATGTFDVKLDVQKPDNKPAETAGLGRMSIDKQFHGDLTGTSQGEMLALMTKVEGSGVYVAIERVNGMLGGNPCASSTRMRPASTRSTR